MIFFDIKGNKSLSNFKKAFRLTALLIRELPILSADGVVSAIAIAPNRSGWDAKTVSKLINCIVSVSICASFFPV
jgi:hypothetical protein